MDSDLLKNICFCGRGEWSGSESEPGQVTSFWGERKRADRRKDEWATRRGETMGTAARSSPGLMKTEKGGSVNG